MQINFQIGEVSHSHIRYASFSWMLMTSKLLVKPNVFIAIAMHWNDQWEIHTPNHIAYWHISKMCFLIWIWRLMRIEINGETFVGLIVHKTFSIVDVTLKCLLKWKNTALLKYWAIKQKTSSIVNFVNQSCMEKNWIWNKLWMLFFPFLLFSWCHTWQRLQE